MRYITQEELLNYIKNYSIYSEKESTCGIHTCTNKYEQPIGFILKDILTGRRK